jgi:hypothetical protein
VRKSLTFHVDLGLIAVAAAIILRGRRRSDRYEEGWLDGCSHMWRQWQAPGPSDVPARLYSVN